MFRNKNSGCVKSGRPETETGFFLLKFMEQNCWLLVILLIKIRITDNLRLIGQDGRTGLANVLVDVGSVSIEGEGADIQVKSCNYVCARQGGVSSFKVHLQDGKPPCPSTDEVKEIRCSRTKYFRR